jgi:hypothetical protein
VDICLDLPGVKVDSFWDAITESRYICRAKYKADYVGDDDKLDIERHQYGRSKTGVNIGRGAILCRIYDKLREARKNEGKNEGKMPLLINNRWGGEIPAAATRVEFQLRREAIKGFQCGNKSVDTVAEYLQTRGAILRYLCNEWLRLYTNPIDPHNTGRYKRDAFLDVWGKVCDFAENLFTSGGQVVRRVNKTPPEPKRLLAQAWGCLTSARALSTGASTDILEGAIDDLKKFKANCVTDKDKEIVAKKHRRYSAVSPLVTEQIPF